MCLRSRLAVMLAGLAFAASGALAHAAPIAPRADLALAPTGTGRIVLVNAVGAGMRSEEGSITEMIHLAEAPAGSGSGRFDDPGFATWARTPAVELDDDRGPDEHVEVTGMQFCDILPVPEPETGALALLGLAAAGLAARRQQTARRRVLRPGR